jgi:hypothetical protein
MNKQQSICRKLNNSEKNSFFSVVKFTEGQYFKNSLIWRTQKNV